MINVTQIKSPSTRHLNLSLTLILKLLMTLLWTRKTHAAWQNWWIASYGSDRKATKWLYEALCLLPFQREYFHCFLSPKTKHLSMILATSHPSSEAHPTRSFLPQWVGWKAINFYLCPFMCRRKICIINNYLTFVPSTREKGETSIKAKWVAIFVI